MPWRPSCPEPLWVGLFQTVAQCECGQRFRRSRLMSAFKRYREHWRDVHELDAYGRGAAERSPWSEGQGHG